jgi:CheY-like chemotaxis protein
MPTRINHFSAAEALEIAKQHHFDLVLSDIGLPEMDGRELMQLLSHKYNLKGIALSGFGTDEDVKKSLESGFSIHLTKPGFCQKFWT